MLLHVRRNKKYFNLLRWIYKNRESKFASKNWKDIFIATKYCNCHIPDPNKNKLLSLKKEKQYVNLEPLTENQKIVAEFLFAFELKE